MAKDSPYFRDDTTWVLLVTALGTVAVWYFSSSMRRTTTPSLTQDELRQQVARAAAARFQRDEEETENNVKKKDHQSKKKKKNLAKTAVKEKNALRPKVIPAKDEEVSSSKKAMSTTRRHTDLLVEKKAQIEQGRHPAELQANRLEDSSVAAGVAASVASGSAQIEEGQHPAELQASRLEDSSVARVAARAASRSAVESASPKEPEEKTDKLEEAPESSPPQKKKKSKKKKFLLPPPQVLCEALSRVFKRPVTVESKAGAGTWGGEGWMNRSSDYLDFATITLPLHSYRPSSMDNEWMALSEAFPELLNTSLSSNLLQKDIQKAILCHTRANQLSRNGFSLLMAHDEGFAEMKSCLKSLSLWLVQQVATWIRPDVTRASYAIQDDEDDDGLDLFSDEYNAVDACASGGLDTLLSLLEETEIVVTGDFLEDLFSLYAVEKDKQLPRILLDKVLKRLASSKQSDSFSSLMMCRKIMAVSNLLTASASVCQSLSVSLQRELDLMKEMNGRDVQALVQFAPLFECVAYSVPPAGAELPMSSDKWAFFHQVTQLEDFPLCVFRPGKGGGETRRIMEEARRTMKTARQAAESLLRIMFKARGKEQTFEWLSNIICSNHPLVNLLKSELLEADGVIALASTRDFLLGLTSTLISFCQVSLRDRLEKMGPDAFDATYLSSDLIGSLIGRLDERNRLFQGSIGSSGRQEPPMRSEFAGATHFFFLSCLLLRVALYPAIRMEDEFHFRYQKVLRSLSAHAVSERPLPSSAFQNEVPIVAAWLGWKSFFEDPDFASNITEFALVQLGWLVAVAQKGGSDLALIPDWMCREPARWMSHLARTTPFWLEPRQAERAVEYATRLLDIGTSAFTSNESAFSFSPIVMTSLIEIASSFVQAGVSRSREKHRFKQRRRFGQRGGEDIEEPDDDQNLDMYLSFDQSNHGVAVFTNAIVRTKLCPTLLRTFRAVDVVEGFDADRDDSFSKHSAKSQIAELLLQLWAHPSGECRESVASLPCCEVLSFASSLATVAGVDLDFGLGALEKIRMGRKGVPVQRLGTLQRAFIEQSTSQAVAMLFGVRRLLILLCSMSQDKRIASYLGGYGADEIDGKRFLRNLSNTVVAFVEKLTSLDGGTNPDLEEGDCEPTSSISSRFSILSPEDRLRLAEDVNRRRIHAKKEYGLDVGILCHQLLALAAKCHFAAVRAMNTPSQVSPLLTCLVENEDFDLSRIEKIFRRLILVPDRIEGTEADNAATIFEHDGYIDHTNWEHKYVDKDVSETQKQSRRSARQAQMKHSEIVQVASHADIVAFIDDLRREMSAETADRKAAIDQRQVVRIQESILSEGESIPQDAYSERLVEWVVSSAPFKTTNIGSGFAHSYDKAIKNRAYAGSGKILVKEVRKCQKTLPLPTPNSAIFVCFAEERMDLCRVVISGPVDTPYAHGFFEFDVYFPPTYPHIPPLVTFMTTGGGQVRFNPNLYTDGKVCISLLGVTNASDESQRWNPDLSSLAQLMISIQSQIFGVKDPYFNEGNGIPGSMRNTSAGREASVKYNNVVRLATLRHAMVGQIRSPPKGFEDLTFRHFSMCRRRIVAQARRWMLEARGTSLFTRYERTYAELVSLLAEKPMQAHNSLPPLPEDLSRLEELDEAFGRSVSDGDNDGDQKPSARSTSDRSVEAGLNPWVAAARGAEPTGFNPWAAPVNAFSSENMTTGEYDSDDELYE